ncbi:MAG TPA: hypothetical protein VK157_10685 [Phycisphaerales bacterium]|nr:hypothetical protein [Phycisphaerales bacterium]
MSEKARRSNAWDDKHLTKAWQLPARWVLKAFSSITMAVILLVFVSLYGISASVPVGLLALAPTYLFYGLTILLAVFFGAGLPVWGLYNALANKSRGLRFSACLLFGLLLVPICVAVWYRVAWPALHYDPKTGSGVEFFSNFVEANRAVTLRRLPGMEMSELQFYSWWPLQVALLLFVVNMVVATVRRIEFNFKNIGVLTVHTGIVVIALGSIYYAGLKKEGDTLLLAGPVDPVNGRPGPGPSQRFFFDNTDTSLWLSQGRGWEQRLLQDVPRYNNYALDAFAGESAAETAKFKLPWTDVAQRPLDVPVMQPPKGQSLVDEDLRFRMVGYSYYTEEPIRDWLHVPDNERRFAREGMTWNPLRIVYLHSTLPDEKGEVDEARPIRAFLMTPAMPAERVSVAEDGKGNPVLSLEYTLGEKMGMSEQRWRDVTERVPDGATHALVVEVPGNGVTPTYRKVFAVTPGAMITVGDTGYTLRVEEITPKPPFPIITEGYKDASSSVAVVNVTQKDGETFSRYVYSRYPELNQDLKGTKEDGRPMRGAADAKIRIALIDCDHVSVFMDEPAKANAGEKPVTRAAVRLPGGAVRVIENIADSEHADWLRDFVPDATGRTDRPAPKISMRVGERWNHAERVTRPNPVDELDQDKQMVGNHKKAMLGVEVTSVDPKFAGWKRVVWIPFSQYMGMGMDENRTVETPDGRVLTLGFGRLMHRFPDFEIRLVDFQMISYDHRGAPRDYQSVVRVMPVNDSFEGYQHVTKLNEPLRAPFLWSDEKRNWFANLFGHLTSNLSPAQFKLSQAGWDQGGWQQTQAQADAGLIKGPYAKFTILGVGNNPGIHVIAFGGILMGLGIPWAFYVKPWLVQREKKRLQQLVKEGKIKPRQAAATNGASSTSASVPAEVVP